MLTQTRLKAVFFYDPVVGVFIRRLKQPGAKVGKISGCLRSDGYLTTSIDGKPHKCHRLAWLYMTGNWPCYEIDHIDGDRANNKFLNLRDIPKWANIQNQRKAQKHNRSTGVLGIFPNGNRFAARLSVNNKKVYLGTFPTKEEAHQAYLTAKRALHVGCTI